VTAPPGENPYAPPPPSADDPGPATGDLAFAEHRVVTAATLARWMRIVSALLHALAIMLALVGALFSYRVTLLAGPGHQLVPAILGAMGGYALVVYGGALCLRRAARHFSSWREVDDEAHLARGLRSVQLFCCAYGLFALFALASDVLKSLLAGPGG
jgi:hypothetical protein